MLRLDTRARTLIRFAAWSLLALIILVTLVPIGLRPVMTANPSIERVAAYAVAGLIMMLSYPRHWLVILIGSIVVAGGLEAAQTLTSTRHGRFDDFLVKAGAALAGAGAGLALAGLMRRRLNGAAAAESRDHRAPPFTVRRQSIGMALKARDDGRRGRATWSRLSRRRSRRGSAATASSSFAGATRP